MKKFAHFKAPSASQIVKQVVIAIQTYGRIQMFLNFKNYI